jgi:glycosyltransferase involved in cell wall biosynthesis
LLRFYGIVGYINLIENRATPADSVFVAAWRRKTGMLLSNSVSDVSKLAASAVAAAGNEPTVSVVIPLFNGAAFIAEALNSVIAQTLRPVEVIVVDDGSVDDGTTVVANYSEAADIVLIRKENGGQSSARNVGIRHARGDLIALLDQDDAWYPNHLAELIKPFLQSRSRPLGWSYGNVDEIDRAGEITAHCTLNKTTCAHPKSNVPDCLREDMFVLPSASLIARDAILRVGGFDERLCGYEDDDLFLRLLRAGYDNAYVSASLTRWRVHSGS